MRASGILMPIFSLPSPFGIGCIGQQAYEFVDFLKQSGQKYWQILPIGLTGYGNSPYQSFSAFAANPYFIDLNALVGKGLLSYDEINSFDFGNDINKIDYSKLYISRIKILHIAVNHINRCETGLNNFFAENINWLNDYALFMAIKQKYGMISLCDWPQELRKRNKAALEAAEAELCDEIYFFKAIQYLFYEQWFALKKYANKNGIQIIGDIPIYVSQDSAELWAMPQLFCLNEQRQMTEVAGCPPDAFSHEGQLWGNPLYNWEYHAATNYDWWCNRISHALKVYDKVRIDHFRGFEGYYAIPAHDINAVNGHWCKGPGIDFINAIKRRLPNANIIAEDLGFLTEEVKQLLKKSGFPGMKVLQFAFDSREQSDYLPHNYTKNCVVYTGTHDNTTTADWFYTAPAQDVEFAKNYLNVKQNDDFVDCFIRAALASVADLAIIPMQDWLALGGEGRINTPSTTENNWQWRIKQGAASQQLAQHIAFLCRMYGR